MRRYFATYRGLDEWLRDAARKVVTDRTARTASGRCCVSALTKKTAKQSRAQRNGKNMPIQGTSADILKRALHLLHKQISGTSAKLVNIVHDEIIVECDAAEAEDDRRHSRKSNVRGRRRICQKSSRQSRCANFRRVDKIKF